MVEFKTNKFLYIFAIVLGFFTIITGLVGSIIFNNNINSVNAENLIPYEYVYFSNWSSHSTNFSLRGGRCWSDGSNIYFSSGTNQYVLDTTNSTWNVKTWVGLTSFLGSNIWTDGTNIYYSNDYSHYILDTTNSTWTAKTWNGLTIFNGQYVWTDGINIYYSAGSEQYVLDITNSTWSSQTWTGLTSFYGSYIWTHGINTYFSNGSEQYVLDTTNSTWNVKTWFILPSFDGRYVWSDGTNIYYSYGSQQYVLDTITSTWSSQTWTGLSQPSGLNIFSEPNIIIFYGANSSTWYTLDREEIEPPEPPEPPTPESDYTQGYIDGYFDAYNDALNAGYDTGYNIGYNNGLEYATNMLSGFGPFLYAQWSIVDRYDYSIIRDDLTGRFTTDYFDKYNGGFINNVDFVNLVFDYEDNNPDDDNAMKIDFDNYLPLTQYNNVVTFNFLYGNEIYFILDDGTTIYIDNDSVTKSISLNAYSSNSIVSIVITFGSSISDYGYFGLGFNANYIVAYNNGFNSGYEKGHSAGSSDGYSLGKNKGYQDGLKDANKYTFLGLISAVVDAPVNAFTSLFNFNILGVNILDLLTGLLTLLIVIVVVKFFLGGK